MKWALLVVVALHAACSSGRGAAREQALRAAIESRRSLDFHCWCRAYRGGLCGKEADALKLTPADVTLLQDISRGDDVQVAFGVAEMLATLGPDGRGELLSLMRRDDEVGRALRMNLGVDVEHGKIGERYEKCATR
jgi:hypothetical protein